MRIIAGSARGTQIFAPKGRETRPTQDKVRESLFNMLQRDTPDADVLDLFAGSGALALEALSRGARSAVLVDCSQDAIAAIRRNVEKLRFDDRATVLRSDWSAALDRLAQDGRAFDLVFLDPPYRMTDADAYCSRMAELGLLLPDATIVVEHLADMPPKLDDRFLHRGERSYGDTDVHIYAYREESDEHA